MHERKVPEPLSCRRLVARLRRLAEPVVPEGLAGRLIAAIPASARPAGAKPPHRWRSWVAGAGLAAAAAAICLVLWPHRPAPYAAGQRILLDSTAPEFVIGPTLQTAQAETDPCMILPPLPDWQ